MAVATGRRPKAISVSKQAVDQAGSLLQQLPEKPKENLSLRDAIDQLQEEIKDALSKGYTYVDVAVLLADKGIVISPATLKRYVSMGRGRAAQARKNAAPGKRRKKAQEAPEEAPAASIDEIDEASAQPDAEEAPKSGRGRRSTKTTEEAPKAQQTTGRRRSSAAKPTSTRTTGRGRKKAAE